MANYPQTKNIIDTNIVTNHNEDITAVVLNMVLTALIDYTKDVNFDLFQALTALGLKVGNLNNLNTVDKSSIVNAINELLNIAEGFQPTWLDMQHAYSVINFPAMQKNDVKVIRILDQNGTMKQDGWATIGGMNGVKVSNYAMLICMSNSAGGTYAAVGYKYAIVGNNVPEPEIITVPTLANLPDEGNAILGVIYLTIDTGNIYYFDASAGDYMQIGSVIEGELINDTTFKDTNQNIVVPDGTHLYKDVENTPERYYKWNGVKYEPFEGSSSGLNWTDAEDNAIPYWNGAESKLKVSKIKEHSKGVVNSGLYIAKTKKGNISGDVQLEDAENFIYTMVGNANFRFDNLSLANDESAVFTMQLTGNFAYAFPDPGIDPLPYIDEYNGSKINYFTIVITETVAGAIKGYYSIQTKQ